MASELTHRVSVAGWIMSLVLTMTLILTLPEITWTSPNFGGGKFVIHIPPNAIEVLVAVLVSLIVTDSVVQIHPSLQSLHWRERIRASWPLFSLPAALGIVVVMAQPLPAVEIISVLAMLLAIGSYVLTLFLLYDSLQTDHPYAGQFTFLLHGIAYLAAFLLFLLLYQASSRLIFTVPLMASTAILLSVELLRDHTELRTELLKHVLVVGLIMGEAALVLAFSPFEELTKGTILTWTFFLLVNICQNGLDQSLRTRLMLNYGFYSGMVLVVIYLIETESTLLFLT